MYSRKMMLLCVSNSTFYKMWIIFYIWASCSFYFSESYPNDSDEYKGKDPYWAMLSPKNKPKCIDIPSNLTLCQDIGYNKMRLPNLLDDETINEVIRRSKSWAFLTTLHCHPDMQHFLCSLFSPVCLDRIIFPCRSLCEIVKAGCEQMLHLYGFDWPHIFHCGHFPEKSNLCIQPQHITFSRNVCSACRQPETSEGLLKAFCRSGYVVKAKVKEIENDKNYTVLILDKRKKFIKNGGMTKKQRRKLKPYIEGLHCECDRLNVSKNEHYIIMGHKTMYSAFPVSFIAKWKRTRDFRRAIKKMKKENACTKAGKGKKKGKTKRKKKTE